MQSIESIAREKVNIEHKLILHYYIVGVLCMSSAQHNTGGDNGLFSQAIENSRGADKVKSIFMLCILGGVLTINMNLNSAPILRSITCALI